MIKSSAENLFGALMRYGLNSDDVFFSNLAAAQFSQCKNVEMFHSFVWLKLFGLVLQFAAFHLGVQGYLIGCAV